MDSAETFDATSDIETPNIDQLFSNEQAAGVSEADETIKASLPPNGTYTTNPDEYPVSVFAREQDDFDSHGNKTGTKRVVATVVARAEATIKGQTEVAFLRFDLSPDRRFKRDFDTGEELERYDSKSLLWAYAVKLTKGALGGDEDPTRAQVIEYLKTMPFRARVSGFQGKVYVLNLTAVGRRS